MQDEIHSSVLCGIDGYVCRNCISRRDDHIARLTRQRDMWHRLFNRLDAAINHHQRDAEALFVEVHDERLYAARRRIYEEAARQGKEERERA